MTSTTAAPTRTLAFTPGEATPIRFRNVLRVEFRKLVSTRSMRVLLAIAGFAVVAITAAMTYWYDPMFIPAGTGSTEYAPWLVPAFLIRLTLNFLVPTAIVLLITSEWGTRSAMTTFTLVPRRGHVVLANGLVTLVVALASHALTVGGAILATVVGRTSHDIPVDASAWVDVPTALKDSGVWLLIMASALGIALLTQNTPLALAIVLAGPTVVQVLRQFGHALDNVFQWLDMNGIMSQAILQNGDNTKLPQLIVATCCWVLLPIILGTVRTLRREAS